MKRGLLIVTTAALAISGLVVVALWLGGGHTRSPSESAAATATTYVDRAQDHCCAPGLHAEPLSTKVSTVNPGWAIVDVRIWDKSGHEVQGAGLVMHRVRSQWTVENIGSAVLGCGVPSAVRSDLGLTCPQAAAPKDGPYFVRDGSFVIKPTGTIDLSGTDSFEIGASHWASWSHTGATAKTTYYVNLCKPDCARGRYAKQPAAVRFFGVARCRGKQVLPTTS